MTGEERREQLLYLLRNQQEPMSGTALAQRFHLDAEHGAALTIGTSVFSVATIPLLYLLVNALF